MTYFSKFFFFSLILLSVACSKDDDDNSRFESELVGDMQMEILKDTETNLVWVNDTRGCFAGIVTPMTECDSLVFAGRSDWRIPTSEEMATLIKAIDDANMSLNYINTSCALMSSSDGVWVFTENSTSPGEITEMMPGNAGLRCVTE